MTGQEAAMVALGAVGVGLAVAVGGSLVALGWGLIRARRSRLGSGACLSSSRTARRWSACCLPK